MKSFSFIVYGSPVAQPRQRHTPLMKAGRPVIGKGGRPVVVNYTPKTALANQWKHEVKQAALDAIRDLNDELVKNFNKPLKVQPWTGPIRLDITVYFPRPQRLMRKKDPDGAVYKTTKPDRDNIDKGILDALRGVVFTDDCQVCRGEVRKFYHEKTAGPRAEIRIEELSEYSDDRCPPALCSRMVARGKSA